MQVEYVAGVRLTSRGALQQEAQRTVGYRVLGKVVVNYQDVLPWFMKNSPIAQPE